MSWSEVEIERSPPGSEGRLSSDPSKASVVEPPASSADPNAEMVALLQTIRDELRQTREALGKRPPSAHV